MTLICKEKLIENYDRVHQGPPGGARKLMEDAEPVEFDPNDYENRRSVLLSLWLDNILTDKQYFSTVDKVDKYEEKRRHEGM